MDETFVVRSLVAGLAIVAGCFLIGVGSTQEVACVFGGIALLFYAFAVMISLPRKS